MTKYKEWKLNDSIGLLVGGTPCQSFSVAGLRKGLDDPRGNLALTYVGILDKFRPKWCVWENVPGVLSGNGGRDFGSFLGALVELGYGFSYRVLDAQYFGVPQRRRRVFVVGCLGDWESPAKVLFESSCLRRDPPPSREKREETPFLTPDSVGTLCARDYKGVGNQYVQEGKCIVTTASNKDVFGTLMANAGKKQWLGNQEAFTGDYHIINRSAKVYETHPADSRVKEMGDVSQTVTSRWGTGGGNVPLVQAISLQDVSGRDKKQNGKGWNDDGVSYTVDTHATQGIAQSVVAFTTEQTPKASDDLAHTLTQTTYKHNQCVAYSLREDAKANNFSATPLNVTPALQALRPSVQSHHAQTFVADMAVRRLTPTECERLQGFPDGYTNIPWRGKEESPDGQRYKAMGNSMAVPVMKWLGKRIQDVDNEL
jgi:DNA (cytosine-5)-methyltransferase 1